MAHPQHLLADHAHRDGHAHALSRPLATAFLTLVLLALCASSAEAQLGKLKKMGAAAIKDAAKEKLGTDKKEAVKGATETAGTGSSSAKRDAMPTLDDDRIALLLASLMPQVKVAEQRAAAAAARTAYLERKKVSDACMERAGKDLNPMAISASAEKNAAKINVLQKQTEAAQMRLNAASKANDLRRLVFLQDTVTILTQRSAALTIGAPCTFEFTPPAMIEERYSQMQSSGSSESSDGFDPGEATRGVMTHYEYGLLRERLALWALLQEDPALKGLGKQGVFSAEEQTALSGHADEIKKLAPLFKRDALTWKTWSDLRDW